MGDNRFNSIAVLDAIPEGELNTARRLREDLEVLTFKTATDLQIRYFKIHTIANLESAISALSEKAKCDGLIPWLHLEGHGADDGTGFFTANNIYCSWCRLVELITPLNVLTNLNVFIILATCFGGSFASAIRITNRAPVLALIGPTLEITAGEIETDFPAFYNTFFMTGSLKKAISALTARVDKGIYFQTTAQNFFYVVWTNYKHNCCPNEQIKIRTRKIRNELKAVCAPTIPSLGRLKRQFRSEEEGIFENYRETFFMYDLYPRNRTRFPVTYKQAEKNAAC